MNVTATRAPADVELLEQCFELRLILLGNADEEQDAAAVACAALREEEQPLMATAAPQIAVQDRFAVRASPAHRVDPDDLRNRQARTLRSQARVSKLSEARLELAAQV